MIDVTTFDDNDLDNFIKIAIAEKERRAQSARTEAIFNLIEAAKKVHEVDCFYKICLESDEGYFDLYIDDLFNALRESL